MSPRAIADAAAQQGLDLIAITDHNTASMTDVVAEAAAERGIRFLHGVEVQTREEVHVLAYFDRSEACQAFAEEIYRLLPDRPNDPRAFGDQPIVDLDENILRFEPRLLLNSVDLSFEDTVERILEHEGLAVPAHIDRSVFGLIEQLGFLPEGMSFPLVEVVGDVMPMGFDRGARLCSSDAHDLDQIGRRSTEFVMEAVSLKEIRRAAAGIDGRSVVCRNQKRR